MVKNYTNVSHEVSRMCMFSKWQSLHWEWILNMDIKWNWESLQIQLWSFWWDSLVLWNVKNFFSLANWPTSSLKHFVKFQTFLMFEIDKSIFTRWKHIFTRWKPLYLFEKDKSIFIGWKGVFTRWKRTYLFQIWGKCVPSHHVFEVKDHYKLVTQS